MKPYLTKEFVGRDKLASSDWNGIIGIWPIRLADHTFR
jgi:hypothetical protein